MILSTGSIGFLAVVLVGIVCPPLLLVGAVAAIITTAVRRGRRGAAADAAMRASWDLNQYGPDRSYRPVSRRRAAVTTRAGRF